MHILYIWFSFISILTFSIRTFKLNFMYGTIKNINFFLYITINHYYNNYIFHNYPYNQCTTFKTLNLNVRYKHIIP